MKSRTLFAIVTCVFLGVNGCTKSGGDDNGDSGDGGDSGGAATEQGQLSGSCALRIINGQSCPAGEGPVALLVSKDPEGNPLALCSGAFITKNKILTAAHCAKLMDFGAVTAYTGDTSVDVLSIIPDPRYPAEEFDTGVATTAFEVNVTPFPLFVSSAVDVGDQIYVYGFGVDEDRNSGVELDYGNSAKRSTMVVDQYEDGTIVAQFDTNQTGACEGDSGGPIVSKNGEGRFGIVAVVHGGTTSTCEAGTVEVFTGVQNPGSADFILSQAPGAGTI